MGSVGQLAARLEKDRARAHRGPSRDDCILARCFTITRAERWENPSISGWGGKPCRPGMRWRKRAAPLVRRLARRSLGHPGRSVGRAGRRTRPPFWVWNGAMEANPYLSASPPAPSLMPHYSKPLRAIDWFICSAIRLPPALARRSLAHCMRPPACGLSSQTRSRSIEHQRETIARAFQCPVRETVRNGGDRGGCERVRGGDISGPRRYLEFGGGELPDGPAQRGHAPLIPIVAPGTRPRRRNRLPDAAAPPPRLACSGGGAWTMSSTPDGRRVGTARSRVQNPGPRPRSPDQERIDLLASCTYRTNDFSPADADAIRARACGGTRGEDVHDLEPVDQIPRG